MVYLGITFPSGERQNVLIQEVFRECGVKPEQVSYVEAHGTGTKAGDPQEMNSLADFFCTPDRKGPLLIGSTKSNMGHPEAAAGKYIFIYYNDCKVYDNIHVCRLVKVMHTS